MGSRRGANQAAYFDDCTEADVLCLFWGSEPNIAADNHRGYLELLYYNDDDR